MVSYTVTARARDAAVEAAALMFGVRPADIKGPSRRRPINRARQYVMWSLRQRHQASGEPLHSYPAIGEALGRDHTTVLHGVRKTEARLTAGEIAGGAA